MENNDEEKFETLPHPHGEQRTSVLDLDELTIEEFTQLLKDKKIKYKEGEPEEWFRILEEKGRTLTKEGISEFTEEQWKEFAFSFGVTNLLKKWASPQARKNLMDLITVLKRHFPIRNFRRNIQTEESKKESKKESKEIQKSTINFKFRDRINEAYQFLSLIQQLWTSFKEKSKERANHFFILLATASGMGKTTFGVNVLKLLRGISISDSQLAILIRQHFWKVFVDFNGGGDRMKMERDTFPQTAMAVRLLARGLFGIPVDTLREKFPSEEEYQRFSVKDVMQLIANEIRNQNNLTHNDTIGILLHIDEHQMILKYQDDRFLKDMFYEFGRFRCSDFGSSSDAENLNLFLIPLLTSTTIEGAKFMELTQYFIHDIRLQPLNISTMWQILNSAVNPDGRLNSLMNCPDMRYLIGDMGGNPRQMNHLAVILHIILNNKTKFPDDKVVAFSGISTMLSLYSNKELGNSMSEVLGRLKGRFSAHQFVEDVGGPKNARQLLLYALIQTPIEWTTKIGDKSIMELSRSGRLTLVDLPRTENTKSTNEKGEQTFTLHFSVLIMNVVAYEIKDELLAALLPFPYGGNNQWREFEKLVLAGFVALRVNLMIESRGCVTPDSTHITSIKTIFPGAYGDPALLNSLVSLQELKVGLEMEQWIHAIRNSAKITNITSKKEESEVKRQGEKNKQKRKRGGDFEGKLSLKKPKQSSAFLSKKGNIPEYVDIEGNNGCKRIKTTDTVSIQSFPKNNLTTIKMSEGTYITIAKENNNIFDGRLILHQADKTAKPYLVGIQIRFSGANKYLLQSEIDEVCQNMVDYVVPIYPQYELILVIVSNRPFADGKEDSCIQKWKGKFNLLLITETTIQQFLPGVLHRVLSSEIDIPMTSITTPLVISDNMKKLDIREWYQMKKQMKKVERSKKKEITCYAQELGFDRVAVDVGGEGDCQFRAVADQYFGDPTTHKELRCVSVAYLVEHQYEMEQFYVPDEEDEPKTFEEYLSNMAKTGTDGDNLTLVALAEHLQVEIIVLSVLENTKYVTIISPMIGSIHQIVVGYYPHHYLSLKKIGTKKKKK